ncbi:MAG: hypothetical protein A2445_05480 [Candidatus Jacksonbacteria bacterium RIFOXYC2_FULL_44_29]|nr:MAG: mismatch repair protein MutL protein [Parcubacteria group bacterium GW2011_GWC2_44_22]OGY75906.1 MAG: hypothetical protein A2240_04110 [Candidatus Jacksonbacteria bacterium RIFOXYA2_FULL_43_12]OGY76919.1 MAG: hypothetical protein A2295_04895 [Candidatus Jacksonbacteria bacterium RIFOXYB2_FULL_44_15]OGY79461.1 MAG: hypothetical protein A2550_04105 [Candidatus Jacksonbacteria bacterium RIFOXYD2_FULL_43_21]OGY80983.1 MAG: hypothetical protein A2445_05480 [Candidatus Jacksonbacteria bacteri
MIHLLPQTLINKIAAGEVVERPASVVKELLENALDAGATQIEVEIEQGGKKLIKVTDNGFGMELADLKLSILPHATSKISTIEDLYQLTTLGFRGEALSSVAAVSEFSIGSRTNNDSVGQILATDAQNQPTQPLLKPAALNVGTTVTCQNLFYNIPARQKFLKSDQTEFNHLSDIFITIALINPQITLTLKHNGRLIQQLEEKTIWEDRVADLLGKELLANMLKIDFAAGDYRIKGLVSKPETAVPTAQYQYIFINNRPVKDGLILKATRRAYGGLIMERLQPNLILSLTVAPGRADFNVHPRKLEVRHENPGQIFGFIEAAVKRALGQTSFKPAGSILDRSPILTSKPTYPWRLSGRSFDRETQPSQHQYRKFDLQPTLLAEQKSSADDQTPSPTIIDTQWRLLGQLHQAYILIENESGLLLIDQHAASERINYENLVRDAEEKTGVKKQLLALPINFELAPSQKNILENNLTIFDGLGLEIEPFGGNTFNLQSVPAALKIPDPAALIKEVIRELAEETKVTGLDDLKKEILHLLACHSAVKFGDTLTQPEQLALIKTLEQTPNNQSCPHGRPTTYQLTWPELEKWFKRR